MKQLLLLFFIATSLFIQGQNKNVQLQFMSVHPQPIIGKGTKGAETVRFGFEGGTCVKQDNQYYIFTTENFDEPKTAAVRLALWKSTDGIKFTRVYQLAQTNFNWNDTSTNLMSPWAPNLTFDTEKNRWSVFHVGYSRKPGSPDVYNMFGRIRRYDSKVPGKKGIAGPYKVGGWLDIAAQGPAWEGVAKALSFSAYKVGKTWYGFLGTNTVPIVQDPGSMGGNTGEAKSFFRASLTKANSLTGRWERVDSLNPVLFDPEFIENTIVTKINDSLYIAVYDGANIHELSYAVSTDGIHWGKEQLMLIPNAPDWLHTMRTPLGLINEGNGIYTIYFTAFDGNNAQKILPMWHNGFGNVGMMKVKLLIDK